MPSVPMSTVTSDRSRRARAVLCLVVVLVTMAVSSPAAAESPAHGAAGPSEAAVTYQPPVDALITDPFRPPLTRYGPGNRGIDYATRPGTSVRVAADGIVVFAGAVAGGLHVTVLHPDGIRTTYSFLAAIQVRQRQALRGGEVVGVTGSAFHVGARRGDAYIDPASLWGRATGPTAVHLVPLDGFRPPPGQPGEAGPEPAEPAEAGPDGSEPAKALTADLSEVSAWGAAAAAAGVGTASP